MSGRNLQHLEIIGIGQVAEEMDALRIDAVAKFREQGCFPCRMFSRGQAVGDAVLPDDEDPRPRPFLKQVLDRSHKKV
jgi:hypothetical protein